MESNGTAATEPSVPRQWVRPRVLLLLAGLLALICTTVILTDRLSPRSRAPAMPATSQSHTAGAGGGTRP